MRKCGMRNAGFEPRGTLAVFGSLLGLFAAPSIPARADGPQSGIIVSIRGNILEVQPPYLTGHVRLMVDEKTAVVEERLVPMREIKTGTRLVVFGRSDPTGGQTGFFIMGGDLKSQGFGDKLAGIMTSQWGSYWGGKLKSAAPLVVTDDDGKDIVTQHSRADGVHFNTPASMRDLLIGAKISYDSDRTQGGIRHLTGISIASAPGRAGVLFATVVSARNGKLTVVPRFGADPVEIAIPANCTVQRQVTLDADTVKRGDTISLWGVSTEGDRSGLVAFALMRGAKTFPIASKDPGASDKSVTGTVRSLSPFALNIDKRAVPVYVTGQTPLVDFAPSSVSRLHRGDMVMLLLSKSPAGGWSTRYVLIDASPIIAFAFAG